MSLKQTLQRCPPALRLHPWRQKLWLCSLLGPPCLLQPHLFWAPQSPSVTAVCKGPAHPFPNLEISLDPSTLRQSQGEAVGLRGAGASPPHCPVPLTESTPSCVFQYASEPSSQFITWAQSLPTHAVCVLCPGLPVLTFFSPSQGLR